MTEHKYNAPAKIVMAFILLVQLTACGGGGGGGETKTGTTTQTIEGSVGDGPVVDATLYVYANDGTLVHIANSDSRARYSASFPVSDDQYPLTIEVEGGIDLVTRRAPDFTLLSAVTGPEENGVININPYTTVTVEMARRMPGGMNSSNVEEANRIVLEQLNFGLDDEIVPDPFHTDVNDDNVAVIVKASETLGEMIRRVHTSFNEVGLSASMDNTMDLVAKDLVDGVMNGSSSSDDRAADILALVSSEVLTEAMQNELKVDGVIASSAMDDAILQVQPDTPFSKLTASVNVNRAMLLQAKSVVAAAAESTASRELAVLVSALQTAVEGAEPDTIDTVIADSASNGLDRAMTDLLSGSDSIGVRGGSDATEGPGPPLETGDPANSVPQLSGSPITSVRVDEVYTFHPTAVDNDGDSLIFGINNKPAWCNFNKESGRLSGVPGPGDIGDSGEITITVSDGHASAVIGPFTIRVNQAATGSPVEPVATRKYNPGHYISISKYEKPSAMMDAIRPGVMGVQKRYVWKDLEPSFGKYDFSSIRADLELLAGQGMRLVAFIEDKTFNGDIPTPSYLRGENTLTTYNGGYVAKRWAPYVVNRYKSLLEEMGRELDDHPALEGIAIQETSMSVAIGQLNNTDYTPEKYRDALIDVLLSAASSFPTSQVFWYMNFLPKHQSYLGQVANAVVPAGVAMGGPDILPDEHSLTNLSYPFFDEFQGKMTLFNSVQNVSYAHVHRDTSYPTKYWTMEELFVFARDRLHVNYVFWNHKTWKGPEGSYTWVDALPVIDANAVFSP